jgi:IPT/TIG domain
VALDPNWCVLHGKHWPTDCPLCCATDSPSSSRIGTSATQKGDRHAPSVRQAFWKGCGILLAALFLVIGIPPQQAAATSPNQPVPYIEAIGPVAVAPGGALFTFTITGGNFTATSQVFFNSTQLTTTFVTNRKLTATVPATLTAAAGTGWIVWAPHRNLRFARCYLFRSGIKSNTPGCTGLSQLRHRIEHSYLGWRRNIKGTPGQLIDAFTSPHPLYRRALELPGISLPSLHWCFLSRRVCPSRLCQFKGSFHLNL